ncbi:MAG: ATP-binding protein [Candidatus Thermoplasmatota archaeon]
MATLTKDGNIEPVPEKRVFYAIIADYSLERSICELVDNAVDQWVLAGQTNSLVVRLDFDTNQKGIVVSDNAGGVPRANLEYLIGPGLTGNSPDDAVIGFFGVGTKRAVVALGQLVTIDSRVSGDSTRRLILDEAWLEDPEWKMQVYKVQPDIPEGETRIQLDKLRVQIDEAILARLRERLGAIYALLIGPKFELVMDGIPIQPVTFGSWSFPPGQEPRRIETTLKTDEGEVLVTLTAGLATESSPAAGDYGLFVYCNNRMIARGLRSPEVGFVRGLIGAPHAGIALMRGILEFRGPAKLMPWNSSKSGVQYNHHTFEQVRQFVLDVSLHYAKLSKNWSAGEWDEKVFRFKSGSIVEETLPDIKASTKTYLPKLPKFRKKKHEASAQANQQVLDDKPWTEGVLEGYHAAGLARKFNMENANRFALILLDSIFEIAMKDYLVTESGQHYTNKQLVDLFEKRHQVEAEIKKFVTSIPASTWKVLKMQYHVRCELVHKKANAPISDHDLTKYQTATALALEHMTGLQM